MRDTETLRVYIETYGCQMNVRDSGMIASILRSAGHRTVDDPAEADVVIVNTCAVRERAERRALGRLRHLRGLAPAGAAIGIAGCVAQRLGAAAPREVPGLGFVVGTDQYRRLPEIVARSRTGALTIATGADAGEGYDDLMAAPREALTAFVSVMRGCNNFCSYCIVPYVRGRERSRPLASIVREVEALASSGTREVTLIGQNVNSYADGVSDFADLLAAVDAVPGIARIRFATSHPKDLSPRLIEAIASLERVCEHLHLPVQSGSNAVLRAMRRSYTRERYLALVAGVRERVPGIALTTDIIVGFPGETERDYQETVSLMERVRFDSAFMFRYSIREGTAAASFDDDVPEDEKISRLTAVIELQKGITSELNSALAGADAEVLVEGPSERDPGVLFGRTRGGRAVVFCGDSDPGDLARVRIERASAWTLHGTQAE